LQTYLFYDIETTGLNKSFDQILHFAAIRTDLQLKEIERHEIKIKLNPDVIPSPYALITHKIGINEMLEGVSELEAIEQIHQWINTPGTISLGYNTLGFDDEFLRFSFYRNLLKPYTHQYANQCYRMDIYPMTVMFFLFKNNVLTWPEKENTISLKLENINAANQLVAGRAHHAMVDVEVTLELARRLQTEREMWDYLHGYFKKETDKTRVQQAQHNIALLVNGKFGRQAHYQCPVLFLGNHQHYTNQTVWLRLDAEEFTQITPEILAEKFWSIQKKWGESYFILPYKERFTQHLTPERIQLAEKNKQWLEKNPAVFKEIVDYYTHYKYPVFPETDTDARLYMDGFWSPAEELFCQRFHTFSLEEKVKLVEQASHVKLRAQALRILGRHYSDALSSPQREEFADYLRQIDTHIDYQGKKRLTPEAALQEIKQIRAEKVLDEEDARLLGDLERHLSGRVD